MNVICKSTPNDLNSEFVKNDLFISSLKNTKKTQNSYYENRNTGKKLLSSLNLQKKSTATNQNSSFSETSKQQVVSITYEEIGLFPRSFNRVFDRFFKQLFFDVENLVIQEYRFYRYLFLTTVKCLFILIFVPLGINFLAKNYLIRPVTEYYWNTHNHEIFLNSYQQKRAFTELKNFEEKIYFESLLFSENQLFFGISENQFEKNLFSSNQTTNKNDFLMSSVEHTSSQSNNKNLQNRNFLEQKNVSSLKDNISIVESGNGINSQNLQTVFSSIEEKVLNKKQLISQQSWQPLQKFEIQYLSSSNNIRVSTENQNLKEENNSFAFMKSQQKNQFHNDLSSAFTNSIQKRLQMKIFELANHYNEESIEAITNFFADVLSFSSLCFLLVRLEIQINITKSFLLEVFFGLDDSKKSLLILFITDLLVGYHSPNIWELFFQTLFDHYGLPESQTTIFLLVATLPVLLDVLFKYLIFRHLNRASPATVATYHAMIE